MVDNRTFFRTFLRIGLMSFGGPAGQIALMHRELVENRNWISDARFLHALNFCMLLPGPEAAQLAIYIGWLLRGTFGGLLAGLLFILPGFIVMMALSMLYALCHTVPAVDALLYGMKAAVLVIVIEAVLRIGRRALRNKVLISIAVLSFIAIFFFGAPFPLIVALSGLGGFCASRYAPRIFSAAAPSKSAMPAAPSLIDRVLSDKPPAPPQLRKTAITLTLGLLLWLVPLALLALGASHAQVFCDIGLFFSKMAVVTFGGAYAALSYVAQEAVQHYHWLSPADMLNGLGLAETTPGPLVLVLQYVGFLAAFQDPQGLPPLLAGILGGTLAAWFTFAPCFLWIFLGAPYIERAQDHPALKAGLTAITAAVTGVILNLAVWFALHVLFRMVAPFALGPLKTVAPVLASFDPLAAMLAVIAALCAFWRRWDILKILALSALLGLLRLAIAA